MYLKFKLLPLFYVLQSGPGDELDGLSDGSSVASDDSFFSAHSELDWFEDGFHTAEGFILIFVQF